MPTRFGQLVVGAPGAGKTTYCEGMRQYLTALGRDPAIINLDPATTAEQSIFDIDITELVSIEGVMSEMNLGPNGAMIYCLEYLNENVDWLLRQLEQLPPNKYVVFDFPGQLELFTHCASVLDIMQQLTKLDYRLTVVNLIDAHHCSDPSKFIAASLLSLTIMVRLEMPHVNVLSKIDLMNQFGVLPMNLEFFTDLQDMPRLLMYLDEAPAALHGDIEEEDFSVAEKEDEQNSDDDVKTPLEEIHETYGDRNYGSVPQADSRGDMNRQSEHQSFLIKRRRLHAAMCELIEDFSLVSYETLDIQSAESVGRVLAKCDRANGYVFNSSEASQHTASARYASSLFNTIAKDTELFAERTFLVQEKYSKKEPEPFNKP